MTIENKITIIEGPPPDFYPANPENRNTSWQMGIVEKMLPPLNSTLLTERDPDLSLVENGFVLAETRLRVRNGPAMIMRCRTAWEAQIEMQFVYRDMIGLEQYAPIVSAQNIELEDGTHVLILLLTLSYDQYISMNPPSEFDPV